MNKAADLVVSRESEAWLLALVEGMPQMIWRSVGQGSWTWSSPQWARYTGQTVNDSVESGWLNVVHPDDRETAKEAWRSAPAVGKFSAELRICSQDGGFRWFQTRGSPIRDDTGSILEWIGTSTDVDDLRRLQSQQKVLVAELQHRTRNLIGVIHSIAMQTLQRADTLDSFRDRFENRLAALSRVQGLLSTSEDEPITIRRLIEMELKALAEEQMGDQVEAAGPDTVVRNSTAQTLALAVHELSTNALKYGALATPHGRLQIHWYEHVRGDRPWLHLNWRETGVLERSSATARRGYGRILIEQALPHQLGAETDMRLTAGEMACTINLPLRHNHSGDLHG
ncbi:HWE histidine kinase domain-containing protein [Sphingomonas sp. PsM26]|nr:HWE histidine kinase domain-containing protein [Sphingomonas sp. PsM26]